jgi:RNA polymerase sigma-70 factor (ECF subfamily)
VASDFELLDRWRAGDAAAGNALFERHFEPVCRFFRNKIDSHAPSGSGVDDLIQRTFLACVESRDDFRGDASFRTYLFTLARNELFAQFKRSARERDRFDPLEQSVDDLGPTPTHLVAKHGEQRVLLAALRRIPLEHQVALELYYWEDLPAPELARVLGIPEGTVRTRLRRAKQLLEAALRRLDEGEELVESTVAGLDDWARSLREQLPVR